jgi:integrase
MPVYWKEWTTAGGKKRGAWYYKRQVDGQIKQGRAKHPDNPKQKAKTKQEAEFFESLIFQRMCQGEEVFKPKPQPWTFERFVEEKYRPIAKENHRHYHDGARYSLTVLLAEFGKKLIAEISPFEIEAFKKKQRERKKKNGRTLKPKTVNIYLDCLSSVFSSAIAQKLRPDNPCDEVMRLEVEDIQKRPLTHEEEDRLLVACDKLPKRNRELVKAAIVILVEGGFRPEEFFGKTRGDKQYPGMKKVDVDLLNRQVTATSYKTGGRRKRKTAQPKKRKVPITDRALPFYWFLLKTPGEKLYPNYSIKRAWASICEDAKIKGFWLRWLRDTFKHRCELAGLGPFEIALLMGHATPRMTMEYSFLDLERALGLMNGVSKTLQKEKGDAEEASPHIRLIPRGKSR